MFGGVYVRNPDCKVKESGWRGGGTFSVVQIFMG